MLGSVRAGTLSYSAVQLFSKYSNLCENLTTALYVASRGSDTYPHIPYILRNYDDRPTFCSRQYIGVGLRNFCLFRRAGLSAVQGHPRSMNLVPIESAYAISY